MTTFSFSIITTLVFILSVVLVASLFLGYQTDQTIWAAAFGQSEPPSLPPVESITAPTPGIPAQLTPVVESTERPSSIVLLNIEWLKSAELAGDAAVQPESIKINSIPQDEDCCYVIQYTPGPIGKAGLAYKAPDDFDLSRADRVVFFAKGENGGENVRFLAAGNNMTQGNGSTSTDIFTNTEFAAVSEPVILDTNWTRYQIDVDGVDLSAIEFPFGFIVERGEGQETVAFSLRDVTYDAKAATDPMPLDSSNATSSLPISMQSNNTQGNITGGLESTVADELQGNATDALVEPNQTNTTLPNTSVTNTTLPNTSVTNTTLPNTSVTNTTLPNTSVTNTTLPNTSVTNTTDSHTTSNQILEDSAAQSMLGSNNSASSSAPSSISSALMPRLATEIASESPTNSNSSVSNSTNSVDVSSTEARVTTMEPVPPTILKTDNNGISDNNINDSINRTDVSSSLTSYTGDDQVSKSTQQYTSDNVDAALQHRQPFGDGMLKYPIVQDENQSPELESSPQSNAITNDADVQQGTNPESNPISGEKEELSSLSPSATTTAIIPSNTGPALQQVPSSDSSTISAGPSNNAPPDTVITSAIDSINGMNIQNGASAASNLSVTFTFEGLDDSGIAGYTCSIENLEPFYCSTPVIYDTSIPQESELTGSSPFGHSFQVSAIDNSGNVDPTPAVFNWMVTDPGSETTAPESFTPNTITPSPPQLPIEQQQLPQITVPGPLLPNTIAPPQLPLEQQQLPQITVPVDTVLPLGTLLPPNTIAPPQLPIEQQQLPQITVPGTLLPPNTIAPPQLPIEQQQLPQITVPGTLLPNTIAPPQLPLEQQ